MIALIAIKAIITCTRNAGFEKVKAYTNWHIQATSVTPYIAQHIRYRKTLFVLASATAADCHYVLDMLS